ncbi:T9SS type A sorting domain-containing protein [Winogradskyella forsetii]|uniref:T9SS type A sorting domain-containing protein n=1 Tax=Winogradskyella forsetii TaxID=2686077 RepID=UPI0015C025FD|nr:T9SS type A sorting domain-containing protein [Winogradskyella forsetii]
MKKQLHIFLLFLTFSITAFSQVANQPNDYEVCDDDNDGYSQFDLTTLSAQVLDSQNPADYALTYHVTQNDADVGVNPIINAGNYSNVTNPQLIYIRLVDPITGNFDTTWFSLIVNPLPSIIAPTAIMVCDDGAPNGLTSMDLSSKNVEITGNNPTYAISYYLNQVDADSEVNPLPTIYTNISNPQIIIARVEDVNSGCFATTTLELVVEPSPVLVQPLPLHFCDVNNPGDEQEVFTLEDANAEIINGQINVTLTYYETQMDADNETNPIVSPYTNTTNPQTLYVRAEQFVTACYDTTTLTLRVLPNPSGAMGNPEDLALCDENNNGTAAFDLTVNEGLINPNGEPFSITYFLSEADASDNVGNISNPNNFTNMSNPQTIYVRVETTDGCYTTTSFMTEVRDCTDTDNDGVIDSDEDLNNNGNLEDDDADNDGTPNYLDDDDDGDNVDTIDEINVELDRNSIHSFIDSDNDLIENYLDDDDDGDNVLTIDEDYNNNGDPTDDDTNGNSIPDYLESAVALSLNEFSNLKFSMFPNPTKDEVTIQLANSNFDTTKVDIYNIHGKVVLKDMKLETNTSTIDISNLESGLYFVQLTFGNSSTVQKLMVD